MVVQHNLTAINSNLMLNLTVKRQTKATESLSSGYRINRAADDAAGLSISEKMRKQIRGLTQASKNCQDGVSLCQVADGALNETSDILQRINELAVKSANGTNSDHDRACIQDEIASLKNEINRIAETTTFNESIHPLKSGKIEETPEVRKLDLLPGATAIDLTALSSDLVITVAGDYILSGTTTHDVEINGANINVLFDGATVENLYSTDNNDHGIVLKDSVISDNFMVYNSQNNMIDLRGNTVINGDMYLENSQATFIGDGTVNINKVFEIKTSEVNVESGKINNLRPDLSKLEYTMILYSDDGSSSLNIKGGEVNVYNSSILQGIFIYNNEVGERTELNVTGGVLNVKASRPYEMFRCRGTSEINFSGGQITVESSDMSTWLNNAVGYGATQIDDGGEITDVSGDKRTISFGDAVNVNASDVKGIRIQAGADSTLTNGIYLTFVNATCKGLGISKLNCSTAESSLDAIDLVKKAIEKVSSYRSEFGSYQNRLEHTINNLDNVVENTTSAESLIRDTEMASLMVAFSANNILAQAGQAMLAQANQSNQGVLNLLG